jgi:RNA polymerase-binding transcription factor DksA
MPTHRRSKAPATPHPLAGSPVTARSAATPKATVRSLSAEAQGTLELLRAREAALEARIAESPELPEISAGGDDIHLVAEALVSDNAAKSFAVDQLADVRAAISAVARGSYGVCTGCQGAIPPARLAIVPDATQCVPCATRRR